MPAKAKVSPATPARLPAADRRRRILETAVRVYARHGFHQTGMRQLCAELGLSAGALYRYFPGKEAIIEGLVELDREQLQANLSRLPQDSGFLGAMEAMGELVLRDLESNAGLLAIWSEISAEATRNPAVAELIRNHYQFIESLLAGMIAEAVQRGEFRTDLDPAAAARLLIALHDGMMTRRAVNPAYPLDQCMKESLALFAVAAGAVSPQMEKSVRKGKGGPRP